MNLYRNEILFALKPLGFGIMVVALLTCVVSLGWAISVYTQQAAILSARIIQYGILAMAVGYGIASVGLVAEHLES